MSNFITYKISLVLATINRTYDVERFLKSLTFQNYDNFEVVIVNQNVDDRLNTIIDKFNDYFPIVHIRSDKGLSKARNIGLSYVSGEIVAFPDDDCSYYPDTLTKVNTHFNENSADIILGRIYDRTLNNNIIRNWSSKRKNINKYNFYYNSCSITIFLKKSSCILNEKKSFDERLGAGSCFPSCEDVDFIYRALLMKKVVLYFPNIHLWHPEFSLKNADDSKIDKYSLSYGLGFGAFIKKNRDFHTVLLFLLMISYHLIYLTLSVFILDFKGVKYRKNAITSRVKGFIKFNICRRE